MLTQLQNYWLWPCRSRAFQPFFKQLKGEETLYGHFKQDSAAAPSFNNRCKPSKMCGKSVWSHGLWPPHLQTLFHRISSSSVVWKVTSIQNLFRKWRDYYPKLKWGFSAFPIISIHTFYYKKFLRFHYDCSWSIKKCANRCGVYT